MEKEMLRWVVVGYYSAPITLLYREVSVNKSTSLGMNFHKIAIGVAIPLQLAIPIHFRVFAMYYPLGSYGFYNKKKPTISKFRMLEVVSLWIKNQQKWNHYS